MKSVKGIMFAGLLLASSVAVAQPVAQLGAGNVGITSFSYSVVGNAINLFETWGNSGPGSVEIRGLTAGANYTVNKFITNGTGFAWTSFANELLDPAGQNEDASDPAPQPAFVPVGFSTSNDIDGLSFAQGSGLPRTSAFFGSVQADELSDARDFLDFFNGVWASGAQGLMTFGLRDNADNQPFLLFQRPNEFSSVVPVPAALPLLLSGLGIFGFLARRKQRA